MDYYKRCRVVAVGGNGATLVPSPIAAPTSRRSLRISTLGAQRPRTLPFLLLCVVRVGLGGLFDLWTPVHSHESIERVDTPQSSALSRWRSRSDRFA